MTVAALAVVALLITQGQAVAAAGQLADAGTHAERLWLLGGVAVALTGAGVIALAATRGPRR
jgi:hypothetical protein